MNQEQLADMHKSFIQQYPVVPIEDPFDQDDWDPWAKATSEVEIQIVRDDLTVTNSKKTQIALDKKAYSCLLLKVNQMESEMEIIKACRFSQGLRRWVMVSSRSDETGEYIQILRIEEELEKDAVFAGKKSRNPEA